MLWDPNLLIYVYQGHSDKNYIEKVIKIWKWKRKKKNKTPEKIRGPKA